MSLYIPICKKSTHLETLEKGANSFEIKSKEAKIDPVAAGNLAKQGLKQNLLK